MEITKQDITNVIHKVKRDNQPHSLDQLIWELSVAIHKLIDKNHK